MCPGNAPEALTGPPPPFPMAAVRSDAPSHSAFMGVPDEPPSLWACSQIVCRQLIGSRFHGGLRGEWGKYKMEVTDGNLRKGRTLSEGEERPTGDRDRDKVRACSGEDELLGVAGYKLHTRESFETWARKLH